MKYIFILLCFFTFKSLSQDSTIYTSNKLEPLAYNYYLYHTKVIHQSDVFSILKETKDLKIMNLASQAKTYRNFQSVGFIAIPALFLSIDYAEKSITNVYNSNGTTDMNAKNKLLAISATCLFITVAAPTISIVMKWQKKTKLKEAVKLYHQKY